jgi:hypothetical protein
MRIQIFGGTTRHKNPNGGVLVYRVVGARTGHRAMSLAEPPSATPTARWQKKSDPMEPFSTTARP